MSEKRFTAKQFDAWANSLEASRSYPQFAGSLRDSHIEMLRQAAADLRTPTAREPGKVTEAIKVLELAEAYRVTCGGRCAHWINPCADYETAEYLSAYAAALATVQPAEPGAGQVTNIQPT